MDCKYIFLDIDGTLVDFQGKLADSALEALKTAKSNGHKLSTARYAHLAHMLWQTASA